MRTHIYLLLYSVLGCNSDTVIEKQENSAPTITIMSHGEGAEVRDGFAEYFRATLSDDDNQFDELSIAWYVGEEVVCDWTPATPAGDATCGIVFEEGDTNVIAEVRDPQGAGGRSEISVSVLPTEAPVVELLTPLTGGTYYSDQLIQFSALVSDLEDESEDLVVSWTSNVDGELSLDTSINASGEISDYTYLTEGNHAIELRVEDTTGKFSTAEVVIQVGGANSAPSCAFTTPQNSDAFVVGDSIVFAGLAEDSDVPNNELSVEVSSNLDGSFQTLAPFTDGTFSFAVNTLSTGAHTITMTVIDEVGAACTTGVLISVGNPPNAQIDEPLDGDIFAVGETVTFRGTVSDSEDQSNQIAVVWNSDLEGELYSGNANSQGISQFTRTNLSAGVHSIDFTATDSTGLVSDDLITFRVNTLPVVDSLSISPDPVYSNMNLSATVTTSDADNQNVTTSFDWYEDGTLTSFTGTTINASELHVGEVWTVRATPNDSYQDGNYVEQSIIISNTSPTIGVTSIFPSSNITTTDLLTCSASGSDIDDGALTPTYAWTSSSGATNTGMTWQLNTSVVSGSDTVTCTSTVTDSNGATATSSSSVTIDNTPPQSTSMVLTPSSNVVTGTTLTCSATFVDAEDGSLTPTYAWSNGGAVLTTGSTYTVLSADTNVGDTIECQATVTDSDGNQVTDIATVTVDNTSPTVSNVSISSASGTVFNDDLLTCSATSTDPDEAVSETYTWMQNGNQIGTGTTLNLANNSIDPNDTIVCQVNVSDSNGGTASGSDTITVGNRLPVVVASLSNLNPEATETIVCSASVSDADGGSPSETYIWTNGSTILGATSALTLTPNSVSVGDTVLCTVTVQDNHGGTASASASASIVNTMPAITPAAITPNVNVTVNDLLTCSASGIDTNDGSLTPIYSWISTNGSTNGTATWQLSSSIVGAGDTLTCTATVTDMNGASASSSASVTLDNTAPQSLGVTITPNSGVLTNTSLTCSATFVDAEDGNVVPTYQWTVGGNVVSSSSSYTVSANETNVGDSVVCTATAMDSDGQSTSDVATITVDNTSPTVSNVTISSVSGTFYNDDVVSCSAVVSDPDETVQPTYQWSGSGGLLAIGGSIDLATTSLMPGDVLVCTSSAQDSSSATSQATSQVTVVNRAPNQPSVSLSPSTPVPNVDDVTCSASNLSDPDGQSVSVTSYSWLSDSGNVATGAILPSTSVSSAETWTCTVTVTDGSLTNNASNSVQAASVLIDPVEFTTCGQTGRTGPAQGSCNSAYSGTTLDGQVTVNSGQQSWVVPTTGTYIIEAMGAKGGNKGSAGGSGTYVYGEFYLTAGEVLHIVVGQPGQNVSGGLEGGGGGGGSFVFDQNNTPLIIAGGGGGSSYQGNAGTGGSSTISSVGSGYGQSSSGNGGYTDNGGGGGCGCGGGGINSNGTGNSWCSGGGVNGGTGGTSSYTGYGGFGGGGGAYHGGGGGGGYTGGGGGTYTIGGGGGGSYNVGVNQSAQGNYNAGSGSVMISQ